MKAGRGQVRETTFQITKPWKNKSPYIVFFVIPKGKHIPLLQCPCTQGCTTLPSAGHHPHPKVMPAALSSSQRVWGWLYFQGCVTIRTESSMEIHIQAQFLFHLLSCLKWTHPSRHIAALTDDVMAAVRAGVMLQQPRIHTFLVESVSARNDTQFLQEQMKDHEKVLPNKQIFHSLFLVFSTWLLHGAIPSQEVLRREKMASGQPRSQQIVLCCL